MSLNQSPQSKINAVIALFSNDQLEYALEEALILVKDFPEDAVLQNIMGACYAGLGQLGSAVKSYEKAIEIDPNYAKAHYNLGGAYHELGQFEDSVKSYEKSIVIDPNYAQAHYNLGNVLKDFGHLDEAIVSYEKALVIKPDYVEAHYSLGIILFDLEKLDEAVTAYQKAIEINPNYPALHNNLGHTYKELGELDKALQCYKSAIIHNPDFVDSHNHLGVVLNDLKRHNEAIVSFERALSIQPDNFDTHYNFANTLKNLGRSDEAISRFNIAIDINPNFAEAHNNFGNLLTDIHQYDEAIIKFNKAISLKPNFSEAYYNMGNLLTDIDRFDEAAENYKKAVKFNPDFAGAYHNLGNALKDLGQNDNAIRSYKKAIDIKPDFVEAYNNLGNFLTELNQFDEALIYYKKAIDIKPSYAEVYQSMGKLFEKKDSVNDALNCYKKALLIDKDIEYLLGSLLSFKMKFCIWDDLSIYIAELERRIINHEKVIDPYSLLGLIDDSNVQQKTSLIGSSKHSQKKFVLPNLNSYPKHPKIRIGYFSPDFREHPVGLLTAELYELHDRDHFEVYAFSLLADTNDEVNLRIKAGVDNFYDVHIMSVKDIVLLSRSLEIDIAIDLGGFTAHSRLDIFAMFAAPIQINYLGYPGTMGSNYYDYIIADKSLISEDSKSNFSENIIYLPNCYMPQDRSRKVSEKPLSRQECNLPEDGFVFCCFNNIFKITPKEFDIWMRLLSKINGSVLWLLKANASSEINLKNEAKKRGVDPERLIFANKLAIEEHLARQKLANLFLDTFTFNAHTTASDALWVGLPVLTKVGKGFAARVASSLLTALEIPELIATSENEYEALALTLATNPEKLATIKRKIVANRTLAALYDTETYTKDLEKAYSYAYERYSSGLQPKELKLL